MESNQSSSPLSFFLSLLWNSPTWLYVFFVKYRITPIPTTAHMLISVTNSSPIPQTIINQLITQPLSVITSHQALQTAFRDALPRGWWQWSRRLRWHFDIVRAVGKMWNWREKWTDRTRRRPSLESWRLQELAWKYTENKSKMRKIDWKLSEIREIQEKTQKNKYLTLKVGRIAEKSRRERIDENLE